MLPIIPCPVDPVQIDVGQVFRRWLRGPSDSLESGLEDAMALVTSTDALGSTVLVVRSGRDANTVAVNRHCRSRSDKGG